MSQISFDPFDLLRRPLRRWKEPFVESHWLIRGTGNPRYNFFIVHLHTRGKGTYIRERRMWVNAIYGKQVPWPSRSSPRFGWMVMRCVLSDIHLPLNEKVYEGMVQQWNEMTL